MRCPLITGNRHAQIPAESHALTSDSAVSGRMPICSMIIICNTPLVSKYNTVRKYNTERKKQLLGAHVITLNHRNFAILKGTTCAQLPYQFQLVAHFPPAD